MKRTFIAAGLFASGIALVLAPHLIGDDFPPTAATSATAVGAVMAVAAVGFAYGSIQLWSCVALGIGAWAFVVPVLLGLFSDSAGLWAHMIAGFMSMLAGIAGHELLGERRDAQRSRT